MKRTDRGPSASLQGQVLRRSERREAAIFVRDDRLWVADFVDGEGRLVDALAWIRFNCGGSSSTQARRRMALESALPLSAELIERIEALVLAPDDTQGGNADSDPNR